MSEVANKVTFAAKPIKVDTNLSHKRIKRDRKTKRNKINYIPRDLQRSPHTQIVDRTLLRKITGISTTSQGC